MSMEGWWMVQTTVRPVLTVLRTVRITMAAALASRSDVGSSCTPTSASSHYPFLAFGLKAGYLDCL